MGRYHKPKEEPEWDPSRWEATIRAAERDIDYGSSDTMHHDATTMIDGDQTLASQPEVHDAALAAAEALHDSARATDWASGVETIGEEQLDAVFDSAARSANETSNPRDLANEQRQRDVSEKGDFNDDRAESALDSAEATTVETLGGPAFTRLAWASIGEVTAPMTAPASGGAGGGADAAQRFTVTPSELSAAETKVDQCIDEYQPAALGLASGVQDAARRAGDNHDVQQLVEVNGLAQFALSTMLQLNTIGEGLRGLLSLTRQTRVDYESNDEEMGQAQRPA